MTCQVSRIGETGIGRTTGSRLRSRLERLEKRVVAWMARNAGLSARVSLGGVFLWFGALKLFPGLSPAEGLAGDTIRGLSGGLVEPWLSVPVLGAWESLLGLGLLTGVALRATLLSFFAHMAGTLTPILLLPDRVFAHCPFGLTLEGQYIAKNAVLIGAAIVVGATLRDRS
jgi:uncharacterized membrane protein YkgB